MPRYFFDINDGRHVFDEDGTELPDIDAARRMAVRTAGAIVSDDADAVWPDATWAMEVSDADRRPLFSIEFRIVASTAKEAPPAVPLRESRPGRR